MSLLNLSLSTSDTIALASLFVAAFAFINSIISSNKNAKTTQKLANSQMLLTSKIAVAESSQKYVLTLKEVTKEFETIMRELSKVALQSSMDICSTFDHFDTDKKAPYLRHELTKCIHVVRDAYDEILTFQPGLYIASSLTALKFIKTDLAVVSPVEITHSFFPRFKKDTAPMHPMEAIGASPTFANSISTIYRRIPADREVELFHKVFPHSKAFSFMHTEIRPRLKNLSEKLEDAIRENNLEIFKIRNIPELGDKFYRVKADIERIDALHFPDLYLIEGVPVEDGISHSLYLASVLYIVSQHYFWGEIR